MSNQSGNIAPRLPTCARHVVALLSQAQFLRIIISASRTIVRHREGQIVTNIAAPRITRSGHTCIATRSLHQASIDHVTTCIAGPGASSSLHQSTPETSASLADQLCHISWTEGFASASQPLPASPCRCFIAHQAIGVRIESQFWESPFFGLLQQISQVLLILVFFAC